MLVAEQIVSRAELPQREAMEFQRPLIAMEQNVLGSVKALYTLDYNLIEVIAQPSMQGECDFMHSCFYTGSYS